MADSFDLNNIPRASDAVPQIPTSSSEVAVRTMASDLELMGQSGGMVGQSVPQGVQVPVTLHPENAEPPMRQPGEIIVPQAPSGRGKHILITLAVVVAILGLLALGYFIAGR